MVERHPASAEDELAEVWRALQGSAAQARVRVAAAGEGASEPAGELRELRQAVEALYRAVIALAARTTTAEGQLADLRAAQHGEARRAAEEPPSNTAIVDETSTAAGRQFDRARPRRGYGRNA